MTLYVSGHDLVSVAQHRAFVVTVACSGEM